MFKKPSLTRIILFCFAAFYVISCTDEVNPVLPDEDRTPPVLEWLIPESGCQVCSVVEISFIVRDENVIDSLRIFRNGSSPINWFFDTVDDSTLTLSWDTEEVDDGMYILEIRAWDSSGNLGISPSLLVTVRNTPEPEPVVIRVPDDFETIQDAVDASFDGDTVRVRPGTYHEMIYFWDKNIWLESELGPEVTIIDAVGETFGLKFEMGQDTTMVVRGFTIRNAGFSGIRFANGSSAKILNCIILTPESKNVYGDFNRSIFINNIFTTTASGNLELWSSYGYFYNNLALHSGNFVFFNRSYGFNRLFIDYNLFYDYEFLTNQPGFNLGEHNLTDIDPLFEEGSFIPGNDSPCIDTGHPEIPDVDGSRSDMGIYGGPWAYEIPGD